MLKKLTGRDYQKIIRLYIAGISQSRIALRFGVTQSYVSEILRRRGVKIRPMSVATPLNENFFYGIKTERAAYWLGFLCADGCINIKRDRQPFVTISLAIKDAGHLRQLRADIKSGFRLKSWIATASDGTRHEAVRLHLTSYKLVADLLNLGIGPRKTSTMRLPRLSPSLMRHFMRGYFDGDGCVMRPRRRELSVVIVGNAAFIQQYREILRKFGVVKNGPIYERGNYVRLDLSGNGQGRRIYKFFYQGATRFLLRKRRIFEKVIRPHHRHPSVARVPMPAPSIFTVREWGSQSTSSDP